MPELYFCSCWGGLFNVPFLMRWDVCWVSRTLQPGGVIWGRHGVTERLCNLQVTSAPIRKWVWLTSASNFHSTPGTRSTDICHWLQPVWILFLALQIEARGNSSGSRRGLLYHHQYWWTYSSSRDLVVSAFDSCISSAKHWVEAVPGKKKQHMYRISPSAFFSSKSFTTALG